MINVATATKLDLLIADTLGEVKYTVLRPSRAGQTAARRSWGAAAPRGAFQHGSVPGAGGVKTGNKCSRAM